MKRIYSLVAVLTMFGAIGCQESAKTVAASAEIKEVPEKTLRHVVLFKFKEEAPVEDIEKINQSFIALPESIPVIKDFEWGLNDSPEDLHQGFTHCYMVTFSSEQDRDSVYAPHPQHQAFVSMLGPHLDKVLVVDYWTK